MISMALKKTSKDDLVTVIIPKPDDVVGDTETVVGVNGVMYQIQYDRPVSVPRNVAEIIEQSKELHAQIRDLKERSVMYPDKPALAAL